MTLADRIAKRRNAIDLTLLQAVTGLRIGEALALTWADVETGDDGTLHVSVSDEVSKTHRGRRVAVLDDRVAGRLLTRSNAAGGIGHVIGALTDPSVPWDRSNAHGATKVLYRDLAGVLGIELLMTARTHVWRTTLNSLMLNDVPEVVRAAFFGHDVAVNRGAYTDLADTSTMVAAAHGLRAI